MNDPAFAKRIDEIIASKNLGIKRIGFYAAGVRNIYSRKGSVASPDDLKGVKIRVQNNPIEVKVWRTFGAIPTPMNFGEVYQALQSGVLDAAENGLAVIESNKHFEAAKYMSQTEHQRNLSALYINEKKLASCPRSPEDRAGRGAEASVHERKKDAELVAAAADRLKAKGAVLTSPDKRVHRADRADPGRGGQELKATDVPQLVRSTRSSHQPAGGALFARLERGSSRCSPRCWRSSRSACSSRSSCVTSSRCRSCGARSCRSSPSSGACTSAPRSVLAAHALRLRHLPRRSSAAAPPACSGSWSMFASRRHAGDGGDRLAILAAEPRAPVARARHHPVRADHGIPLSGALMRSSAWSTSPRRHRSGRERRRERRSTRLTLSHARC